MASKPVIFLDMDGVISTRRAWTAQKDKRLPHRWIDAEAVKHLNGLCDAADAEIVVSSTWRLGETRGKFSKLLRYNNVRGVLHDDWRTKDLRFAGADGSIPTRGDEVREWLSRHPEVSAHVILDDDSDFYPDQPLVLTEFEMGLNAGHVALALALLAIVREAPGHE